MKTFLKACWNSIVNPNVRLPVEPTLNPATLGKDYVISQLLFFVGSLFPVLLVFTIMMGLSLYAPDVSAALSPYLVNAEGTPNLDFVIWMCLASTVCGFAAELSYINSRFKKVGKSFASMLKLNLDSLKGPSRLATVWAAIWRIGVAYGVWLLTAHLLSALPNEDQPTVTLLKSLMGTNNVWLFFIMAAIMAPILEEITFRGYLFQSCRSIMRTGWLWKLVGKSESRADFASVMVSSACFALAHFQFHPTTLLMLFLMGCLLAELYRRSGSLICGIWLHAINNGLAVYMILSGKS